MWLRQSASSEEKEAVAPTRCDKKTYCKFENNYACNMDDAIIKALTDLNLLTWLSAIKQEQTMKG